MTANQLRYWDIKRQTVADAETARSNKAREAETYRTNTANEAIKVFDTNWRGKQAISQEVNRWVRTPSEISANRAKAIGSIGNFVSSIFKVAS